MAVLRKITPSILKLTGPQTVTLSGTVKDAADTALANRSIRIFADQAFKNFFGQTYSASDGAWSFTAPGTIGSKFVVVAQGENGENAQVFIDVVKAV